MAVCGPCTPPPSAGAGTIFRGFAKEQTGRDAQGWQERCREKRAEAHFCAVQGYSRRSRAVALACWGICAPTIGVGLGRRNLALACPSYNGAQPTVRVSPLSLVPLPH